MGEQVIVLTDLTKQYGNFTAVDHIRLHIQKGEIFGLLGPNGAGKSTTILMMLGLTEPTSGSVEICGINSTTHPIEVKRKIGYLPEDVGFYDDMTGLENLIYTARLNGIPENIHAGCDNGWDLQMYLSRIRKLLFWMNRLRVLILLVFRNLSN